MADPYRPAPWQQGDILRADELNAMQTGLSPLGTIIPWALPWNPTDAPGDYSNVTQFAPFHLPCTGVVYPRTRAPELCAAIGHTFVDGEPDVGDVGDYVSGKALNKHHGSGYENDGIYKRTATGFDVVEADGFCTPDFRGRSPIGVASGLPQPVCDVALGERAGDSRVPHHLHGNSNNGAGGAAGLDLPGVGNTMATMSTGAPEVWKGAGWAGENGIAGAPDIHPVTGVNFLIACGVSGSATPSTRSGEIHRLHAVTNDHMIRQRLADPNLSDEEREMLEAQLAGEPWPPPVDEPPATRTTTTTRKTATKTKTTRKRKS